jgi:hypothetical protein
VLPLIGAISCVSGGSWFGAPFTFAPTRIGDDTLLGPVVAPEDITIPELDHMDNNCLGAAIHNLSNDNLLAFFVIEYLRYKFGEIPHDKIWARVLNDTILLQFGLENTEELFTLDQQTLEAIRNRNPGLAMPFRTMRPDRPFFIAGATQIYPLGNLQRRSDLALRGAPRSRATRVAPLGRSVENLSGQVYRHFEFTPAYAGTAQLFPHEGVGHADFGNGYVESFAFDTPSPTVAPRENVATVPVGKYPFLLSDVIGSSSAALAAVFDALGKSYSVFPCFDYWPIKDIGAENPATYSFGDGGILENTGIIPLLRRGYHAILAFVNSPYPVNSDDPGCVQGIDGQISRLFGFIPSENDGSDQNTQIFSKEQFKPLAAGLKAARAAGGPVVHADYYPIQTPNPFALAPYTPQIFWIYNDWNESWYKRLPSNVKRLFKKDDPSNRLTNFPNYDTFFQNEDEVIHLTRRQVNLLAHMWCYTMQNGFTSPGTAFGVSLAKA